MNTAGDIKVLFIIVNAGSAETAVDIAREQGVSGATILNARGIGTIHKSIMGITVDKEKEIILILVSKEKIDRIIASIKEKAGTSVNPICFVMPVEKVTGLAEPRP